MAESGRVSVPVWLIILRDRLLIIDFGKLLPHQLANQTVWGTSSHFSCCSPPKDRFLHVTHSSAAGNLSWSKNCGVWTMSQSSVADLLLGQATDHRLGKLLSHQLANQMRTSSRADSSFCTSASRVLAVVFSCCSPPKRKFLRVTHSSATENTTSCPTCINSFLNIRSASFMPRRIHFEFSLLRSFQSQLNRKSTCIREESEMASSLVISKEERNG
ncbi:hypothetical protein SDJN02_22864, partial [Cucurbita argyrosperma subsp. argyrosperma]